MAERELPITREESSLDNSYANREKKAAIKPVDPIVPENHRRENKSLGKKFTDTFFGEDMREVGDYFVHDMLIPGIKSGFLSILEMMFFGETRSRWGSGRTNYRRESERHVDNPSYYRTRDSYRNRENYRDARRYGKVDYRDIVIDDKQIAERVVRELRMRITENGQASVADLLEMCRYRSEWTDTDYGWVDENDIGLKRVRDGYLIDVAEATDLR